MPLQSSGAISLNQIHVEAGGTSGTTASINDSDIRGLISKASGVTMSFSEWYGASAVVTPTFINSTSNNNPESDNVVISITAPTGSNAFIGVAQDTSTTNISLSGSPTNINPSNLTGGTRKAQGFYKASPGTTAIGFQATRHSIVGMGFANVTSLAQNVSSATTSTGTVSVTRTTATNKTFIGLAASHASSDNDSIPNFSGYTAERKTGNNEELRGGAGVAYKHGTGSSVTYTHVYGGADGLATEYGFHELVR
jgi:hypothetical protein